jgi:hypothetical protein
VIIDPPLVYELDNWKLSGTDFATQFAVRMLDVKRRGGMRDKRFAVC